MFEHLVHRIGFGWTMRALALMLLGLQFIALLTVRSHLKHRPKPLHLREFFEPFKETPYTLNALGCFCAMWGILIPFNYIALSAQSAGISPGLAIYMIPILNGAR